MTVIDLVNRERGRLSRLIAAAGGAAAIGCAALLLAAGVVALGRARWIDLPRVLRLARRRDRRGRRSVVDATSPRA